MASGFLAVEVDTLPPSDVTVSINGDYGTTDNPEVRLLVRTWDYLNGQQDVVDMLIWGDVDPSADPRVATTEGASEWRPFEPMPVVVLAHGQGERTVSVKVRDNVGNVSTTAAGSITLTVSPVPIVTIVQPPIRFRHSLQTGYNSIQFGWRADRAFSEYKVLAVDNIYATVDQGKALTGTNVAATGTFAAGTRIDSTVGVSGLLQVSEGSGGKILKAFVRAGSVWSN